VTTYAQLAADVQSWSARTDIASQIPTMCALFEARVNRSLRVRQMETAFAGTIVDSVIALPTGWLQFKRLWMDGYEERTLQPTTVERIRFNDEGIPKNYAVDGTNVRFDGSGDVSGVYYKTIPSLYADGYNWLSVLAYDAYLFGVLAEVAEYMKDDAGFQKNFARSTAVLDSIAGADKRLSGPLVARAA
jgi:hypothetical protein